MKYLPYMCLLLLGACASQSRDLASGDKWESYDPGRQRDTYDRTYTHPSDMSADQLVARAAANERKGREDEARVDYHQAFRRDRWHPEANERYQDLMLRNGLFDTVWHEYIDLWQQHPGRGDALWYHLRPMLIEREGAEIMAERRPALTDDARDELKALLDRADAARDDGDTEAEREAVTRALEIADLPGLHGRLIALAPEEELEDLRRRYAERAGDNPASGNAAALHALVVARTDPRQALAELREAWILELPGVYLRYAMAEVALARLDEKGLAGAADGELREARGLILLAMRFLKHSREQLPGYLQQQTDVTLDALELRLESVSSSLNGGHN